MATEPPDPQPRAPQTRFPKQMTKAPSPNNVRIVASTVIVLALLVTIVVGFDQLWFAPQRRAIQADRERAALPRGPSPRTASP